MKRDVVFNHDIQRAVITLGWTKGGKRRGHQEYVILEDASTMRLLWAFMRHMQEGN